MKTILILVGKTTDKHFAAGINDYASRINHYMPFEIITIPELKNTKSLSEQQQKTMEGELIMKQLQPSDTVVLLDEYGKEMHDASYSSSAVPMVFRHLYMSAPTTRYLSRA